MGILNFFVQRRNTRIATQMASELAQRSYPAVLDRVRRRVTTMRISEARGYVRARALDITHRELAAMHQGHITLEPALQTEIISRATEAVVVQVLAEIRSVPKAAAKSGQRRAA